MSVYAAKMPEGYDRLQCPGILWNRSGRVISGRCRLPGKGIWDGSKDRIARTWKAPLVCRDFEEYARTQWIADNDFNIRRGGFWHTYCCDWDGTPLPVRMLRFDRLREDWLALIRDWELPDMELGRVNSSGLVFDRGMVSDGIYSEIMDYCWGDRERCGFG